MEITSIKENKKLGVELLDSENSVSIDKTQMFLDSIEKADDDFCEIVLSGQGRGVMCRDINLD